MKIIQFIHPGRQNTLPRTLNGHEKIDNIFGIRYWNQDRLGHFRKFISQNGYYLKTLNSQPQKDNLNFWGEWEAQSFYKRTNLKHPVPNSIHKPIFIKNDIPLQSPICHSTDPYIFNKYHLFTHCGVQFWDDPYEGKTGKAATKLADLCFFENIVKAERNSESVFFQIKPNISNKGNSFSTPVDVYYYLSTDKKLDVEDKLLIRSQIPKVNAGRNYRAAAYETVSIPELEIKHRTVYYVIGFIDPQHKIRESDEDNNKIYIEVRGLD